MIDAFDSRINFFEKHKYLDLKTRNMYLKIIGIMMYANKLRVKDLNDRRISFYIETATKLAEELQGNEYLNNTEKNNIKAFLENREKFYKKYCIKRNVKRNIFKNFLYYD